MITPPESDAMNKRIADRARERLTQTLRQAWEEGAFGFRRGKPQERLMGYLTGTLGGDAYLTQGIITDDLALVLSDSFWELRKGPREGWIRLRAEVLNDALEMAKAVNEQALAAGGQAVYPEADAMAQQVPLFWVHLLRLPVDTVPTWAKQDLWELIRAHDKRVARIVQAQEPVGMVL